MQKKCVECNHCPLQVAVKEAREIIGNLEADIYQEFLLEAHTIHDLQHDNITSLYGVITIYYFVF